MDCQQCEWQEGENVEDFLKRIPPSNGCPSNCPWIWISHPNKISVERDYDNFFEKSSKLLDEAKQTLNEGKWKKECKKILQSRIEDLAKQHSITCGKWMLFISEPEIDEVWERICRGVIDGRFGVTAKVAAKKESTRLICVYNEDFTDKDEVTRIAKELLKEGLFDFKKAKDYFYKCDAYTCLDIYSGNKYGLKASIYNAKALLKL